MEMQRLFQPAKFIRKMIDIIPPLSDAEPTMMVLEPFEKTLWSARTRRPLTTREIRHIMKLALLGLREIHEKGLILWYVYTKERTVQKQAHMNRLQDGKCCSKWIQ